MLRVSDGMHVKYIYLQITFKLKTKQEWERSIKRKKKLKEILL